jgi:hypothetical protein
MKERTKKKKGEKKEFRRTQTGFLSTETQILRLGHIDADGLSKQLGFVLHLANTK